MPVGYVELVGERVRLLLRARPDGDEGRARGVGEVLSEGASDAAGGHQAPAGHETVSMTVESAVSRCLAARSTRRPSRTGASRPHPPATTNTVRGSSADVSAPPTRNAISCVPDATPASNAATRPRSCGAVRPMTKALSVTFRAPFATPAAKPIGSSQPTDGTQPMAARPIASTVQAPTRPRASADVPRSVPLPSAPASAPAE